MFALRLGRLRPRAAAALRGPSLSLPFPSLLASTYLSPSTSASVRLVHSTPMLSAKAGSKYVHRSTLTPMQRKALSKKRALAAKLKGEFEPVESAYKVPRDAVLTLDDLEPFKPAESARPRSRDYAQIYAEYHSKVYNAFVRDQVKRLARLANLPFKSAVSKDGLVELIMDKIWDWPKPLKVDRKVYTREIPLTKGQMFALQRSNDVEAYLSELQDVDFNVEADDAGTTFTLLVHGLKDSVAALDTFIATQTRACVSVEWPTPQGLFQPSERGLWQISRATGAFVEVSGFTTYRATAMTREAAEAARDMVIRAAARAKEFRPMLSGLLPPHNPNVEMRFALVPHVPATLSPLPWTTALAVAERPLFRLSLVESRQESTGARELRHRHAGIAEGRVLNISTRPEPPSTLGNVVAQTIDKAALPASNAATASSKRSLAFRFGHLLAQGTSATPEKALTPPIDGAWPIDNPTTPWLNLKTPVFSPALPPALIRFPLPGAPKRLRRVTYVADRMRYVAEYAYPEEEETEPVESSRGSRPWILELDKQIALAKQQAEERAVAKEARREARREALENHKRHGTPIEEPEIVPFDFGAVKTMIEEEPKAAALGPLEVTATMGREAKRDVIMPDRPIDTRVVAASFLPAAVPEALTQFFERVHATSEAARSIPLVDEAGLRRGKATPPPPRALPGAEEEGDAMSWGENDDGYDHEWEGQGRGWGEPEAEAEAVEEVAAEEVEGVPEIIAPQKITVAGHVFVLESDEVLDVVDSSVALELPQLAAVRQRVEGMFEGEEEGKKTERAERRTASASLRTVAVTDLTGPGGVVRYAELHADLSSSPSDPESESDPDGEAAKPTPSNTADLAALGIDPAIWRELANATREVPPSLRGAQYNSM